MRFIHKVYNHKHDKRKVWIDFGGYGPNSLGIKGKKGAQISILVVSRQRMNRIDFEGFGSTI